MPINGIPEGYDVSQESGMLGAALRLFQHLSSGGQLTQTPTGGVASGMGPSMPTSGADLAMQLAGPALGYGVGKAMEGVHGLGVPDSDFPRMNVLNAPQDAPINVHDLINARDSVYHATDLHGFNGVMNAGAIKNDTMRNFPSDYNSGVSVSRVPRVLSKGAKAISFVLDPKEMPTTRPFTEPDYQKTQDFITGHNQNPIDNFGTIFSPSSPNPRFEFENRTYGQDVPLISARTVAPGTHDAYTAWASSNGTQPLSVKGIVVDKKALRQAIEGSPASYWPQSIQPQPAYLTPHTAKMLDYHIAQIQKVAAAKGIPVRIAEDGKQLHSYRAGFSKMKDQGQALWGLPVAAGLGMATQPKDSQ